MKREWKMLKIRLQHLSFRRSHSEMCYLCMTGSWVQVWEYCATFPKCSHVLLKEAYCYFFMIIKCISKKLSLKKCSEWMDGNEELTFGTPWVCFRLLVPAGLRDIGELFTRWTPRFSSALAQHRGVVVIRRHFSAGCFVGVGRWMVLAQIEGFLWLQEVRTPEDKHKAWGHSECQRNTEALRAPWGPLTGRLFFWEGNQPHPGQSPGGSSTLHFASLGAPLVTQK